jgi:hypothetical protein
VGPGNTPDHPVRGTAPRFALGAPVELV